MNSGFGSKRNRKNSLAYILSAVTALVCCMLILFVFFEIGRNNAVKPDAAQTGALQNVPGEKEMRGVWIASTLNINFPSERGLSEKQLKAELDKIVENTKKAGLNTIFFQVRPCADALYKSDIFPQSKYVSGVQCEWNENSFDALSYLLKQAKKQDIDVHAWVNPFRVTMYESDEEGLCDISPAVKNPEYTVKYADGKTYFNPGIPEVRELVISGVAELCQNYPDLSGIHYDDYFYPYPHGDAEFDDAEAFEKYGSGMSLSDWRRQNINTLVEDTYNTVKELNKDMIFGVSVFGIWANEGSDTHVPGSKTSGLEAYNDLYCDALTWANGGYVDYIAPQNYWSFDTKSAPFDNVAHWWNANLDGTGTKLYMGHAAYKSADYADGEIARQVEFSRTLLTYGGSIFYGYADIADNTNGLFDDISELYKEEMYFAQTVSDNESITFGYPKSGDNLTTQNTYIIGSSNPALPVAFEGQKLSRTKDGYFTAFATLSKGQNNLVFVQGDRLQTLKVGYKYSNNAPASYKTLDSFEIGDVYPASDTWLTVGDTLYLSCVAPSDSKVTATIGGMTVALSPTVFPPDESEYMYERYTGKVTPSDFLKGEDIVPLGTLVMKAEKGDNTAEKKAGLVSQIGSDSSFAYAEVNTDYSYTKISTESSYYEDFLPSSKGMRDYITKHEDGYYKLAFGGYIAEENLNITYGRTLLINKLLTTAMQVYDENPTNNDNNTTDLRFGATENVPVDVDFKDGFMRIIMYNTDQSIIPEFKVVPNPLVASVKGEKGTKENMVIYKVKLKDDKNFYGFKIVYENGMLIVKLNNPQKLYGNEAKPLYGKTILVDAGHGGNDGGAPGPGKYTESVLNYNIASRLAVHLRELGAEVIESRTSDITVSLYERMDLLTAVCPDLAVSIHHNSLPSNANPQRISGFLGLYSNNSGVLLTEVVSDVVCRELNRNNTGTKYQQLAVARNHMFPSTLLEMSYISNVQDYQWTITEGNYDKSAKAVVNGILEYYRVQEAYLDY